MIQNNYTSIILIVIYIVFITCVDSSYIIKRQLSGPTNVTTCVCPSCPYTTNTTSSNGIDPTTLGLGIVSFLFGISELLPFTKGSANGILHILGLFCTNQNQQTVKAIQSLQTSGDNNQTKSMIMAWQTALTHIGHENQSINDLILAFNQLLGTLNQPSGSESVANAFNAFQNIVRASSSIEKAYSMKLSEVQPILPTTNTNTNTTTPTYISTSVGAGVK